MTYQTIAEWVRNLGPVYFGLIFLAAVAYALWPKNRDKFRRAARLPLEDDKDDQNG